MNLILSFKSGFNTQTNQGAITIYLEDNTSHNFLNLSQDKFIALMMVLNQQNAYWDGTWIQVQ